MNIGALPQLNILNCKEVLYLTFATEDLISNALKRNGEWEEDLLTVSKIFLSGIQEPLVLDIGANLGAYAIPLAKALQKVNGSIYAFEVQRIVYYQLCANILVNRLKNVFAINKAIGEIDAEIEIPVMNYENSSNIGAFSIDKKYWSSQGISASMTSATEKVPMVTLDNLSLPKIPSLIKMDVEGYELNVLKGSTKFLDNNLYPPILFEAWNQAWFEKEKNELMHFLSKLGYTITNIQRDDYIAQHSKNPVCVEFIKQGNGTTRVNKIR